MALKRVHAVVIGKVQGVFFRACTKDKAKEYLLSGWVRNLPGGSVEAEFQGEESDVERLSRWLRSGSPLSEVEEVVLSARQLVADEIGFIVKY